MLVVMLFMLVIAVIGAAAGEILNNELGLPRFFGVAIILFAVVVLNFYGRELVTRVLAFWSLLLYAVFVTYLVTVFVTMSDAFTLGLEHNDVGDGWFERYAVLVLQRYGYSDHFVCGHGDRNTPAARRSERNDSPAIQDRQ